MNELGFVSKREDDWKRLTHLCDLAENSPASLKPADFQEFVRLYRRVSGDLAVIRSRSGNAQLTFFLNELVGRAYGILYRTPRGSFWAAVRNAIVVAAQTVRRRRYFALASLLIFVLSTVGTYALMEVKPETRNFFIPAQEEPLFEQWKKGEFDEHTGSESAMMASFYASHNPVVAIMTGSTGAATFGVLPLLLLYQNGVVTGALSHEMAGVGKLGHLWISITPHGVTEMSGLVVSGAAGLVFGWALINPGRRRRGQALLEEGKDALILLGTSVVLMFIAAPIEGFFSFNPAVPDAARLVVIIGSLIAWGFFWTFFGKKEEVESGI